MKYQWNRNTGNGWYWSIQVWAETIVLKHRHVKNSMMIGFPPFVKAFNVNGGSEASTRCKFSWFRTENMTWSASTDCGWTWFRSEKKSQHNWLVVLTCFNHLEKYEFVNGKDYPIYEMENNPNVWNHQPGNHLIGYHSLPALHFVSHSCLGFIWP